ncbi:hypothetical protein P9112_005261 [Eukaryota sp. TZLM1-RC]
MATFQYPSSTFAEKLFHTTDFSDVTLVYLEHEFALHRNVLSVFSRYLHQMFTIPTTDRDLQRLEIYDLPIDVTIFQDFINALYCQPLEITNENVFDIFYTAEYFKAVEIVERAFSFIQHLSSPHLVNVIHRADECVHYSFIKKCCPLLDKLLLDRPLVLKEESFEVLSMNLTTTGSIKWMLLSMVDSYVKGSISVEDVDQVLKNCFELVKQIEIEFIWNKIVKVFGNFEDLIDVLLEFSVNLLPNFEPSKTKNDWFFWLLMTVNQFDSHLIDEVVNQIPGIFDLGERQHVELKPITLIKLSGQLKSINHVMWLIKSFVKSWSSDQIFTLKQVKNVLTLLEVKDIPFDFVYFELFSPFKMDDSLSTILIEFSIKCFGNVKDSNRNPNWFVETIELADRENFNSENLETFMPKFSIINADPISIKPQTFKKLKSDNQNDREVNYWLLNTLVTSYSSQANHSQGNSDWSVEIFKKCLYSFDFDQFTFADLNEIIWIPLSKFDELSRILVTFSVNIMNSKVFKTNEIQEVKEKSFGKVIFQLKSTEITRMVSVEFCHLFQSILIDGVIDLSDSNIKPSLVDEFLHEFNNSTHLSAFMSFIQHLNSNNLKEKLIEAFTVQLTEPISKEQLELILGLEIKQELKQKFFIHFVSNIDSINVQDFIWILNLGNEFTSYFDFESLTTRLQFNTLSGIEFKTLVNYSIKYSNSWLLGKAIDHYEFGSIPEVFTISSDLLLNLNLSNSINKNKEEWLEGVIVGNCSFDIIHQLSQKLLGRETKFMKFNTNQSGSGMVFSEGNRRVLNNFCDGYKHCNFAAIDFNPTKFKIAIKRTRKVTDTERIGFWTMDDIRQGRPNSGTYYRTNGWVGSDGDFALPRMNQGDILYVNIENNQATFSLNGRSDTKPIPSGTVFGIWIVYKGSEYSIVDY